MPKARNIDFYAGVALLILGVAVLLIMIPYGVAEPKKVRYAALSPSYYPRIVAASLALIGLAVTLRSFASVGLGTQGDGENRPDAVMRTVAVLALLLFTALVLTPLGFVLTSAVVLAATIWFAGESRYWLIVILAISVPVTLHFFFLKVAGIPIPLGVPIPILGGI